MVVSQLTQRSLTLSILPYFSEYGVIQSSKSSSSSYSIMVEFLLSLESRSSSFSNSWLMFSMEHMACLGLLRQLSNISLYSLCQLYQQELFEFHTILHQAIKRLYSYQQLIDQPQMVFSIQIQGLGLQRNRFIYLKLRMSQQMRRMVPRKYYTNHYSEITFKTSFHNCVLKALQNRKWRQIETTGWNLQWSQKQRVNDVFEEGLTSTQRCNHFRLWGQLCRKDMMIKNIRKHKRQLQKEKTLVEADWDFLPLTYFLPSEYIMFAEDFRRKGGLWIMKPTSRCQGQGIFIIDKLAQVAPFRQKVLPGQTATPQNMKPALPSNKSKKEEQKKNDKQSESQQEQEEKNDEVPTSQSYLIQQYISRPLLFGSKKFDLRIYCLCTNYSQLTAWLYRSGFARFTHEPYNPDNIGNLQSHLTNVEIQKHSQNYDERRGGKWLIDKFKHYLLSRYDPALVDWCFTEIKNIIIRSLQSVQKSILPSKNSFQLYGYDFMIDADLKPWLIQINGGPSMTANTDFDCRLKCGLIDDVLTIIDIQGMLEGNEMAVGGFDLIIDKGIKVVQDKHSQYTSFLGVRNQRVKVLRHLIRKFLMRKITEESKENNEQKEVQVKIKKKAVQQKGKEKLLPSFYYRRRMQDINSDIRQQLQEQLQILQQNEAIESNLNAQFTPLKLPA